ncbi:hypothetical protein LCGC14_3075810, partial [marine sediment metagenome]
MNRIISLLLVAVILVGFSTVARAEEDLSVEVGTSYMTKYIWRGQLQIDDPVLTSSATVKLGKLTGSAIGYMDTSNNNGNEWQYTEVDSQIDYSDNLPGLEGWGFSIGVVHYDFPNTKMKDTTEVYYGLNVNLPLNPNVKVYHDIDEVKDGIYAALGVSQSIDNIIKVGETSLGINLSASLGWGNAAYNKAYWGAGVNNEKVNDLTATASIPIRIASDLVIAPNVTFVSLLSDDARSANTRGNNDQFVYGISLVKSF